MAYLRRFIFGFGCLVFGVFFLGISSVSAAQQSVSSINTEFAILDSLAIHSVTNTHIFDSTVQFNERYYFTDPLVAYVFARDYDREFYGDAYVFSSYISSTTSIHDWIKQQAHRYSLRSGRQFQYSLFEEKDNYIVWNFNLVGEPPKLTLRVDENTLLTLSFGQDYSDTWIDYVAIFILSSLKK